MAAEKEEEMFIMFQVHTKKGREKSGYIGKNLIDQKRGKFATFVVLFEARDTETRERREGGREEEEREERDVENAFGRFFMRRVLCE